MLEGLDRIPWAKLTHAYGTATDVPINLRSIASEDPRKSEEALDRLIDSINHQGTIYSASSHAVPFLVELLEHQSVACRAMILDSLEYMARGCHSEPTTCDEPNFERDTYVTVVAGTGVYLGLLSDNARRIRLSALRLLGSCVERIAEIEVALRKHFVSWEHTAERAILLETLRVLWRANLRDTTHPLRPPTISYIAAILNNDAESVMVRLVASMAMVDLGGDAAIELATPVFLAAIDNYDLFSSQSNDFEELRSPVRRISWTLGSNVERQQRWLSMMLRHPDASVRRETIEEIAFQNMIRRSIATSFASQLVEMFSDADLDVRLKAVETFGCFGRARSLAVAPLTSLCKHADGTVAYLANSALQALPAPHVHPKLLGPPSNASTLSLVQLLGENLLKGSEWKCVEAIETLECRGESAQEAVFVLRECLGHRSEAIRVRGARALWSIEKSVENTIGILIDGAGRDTTIVSLLAIDGLGAMGKFASPAIVRLREIVESDKRLPPPLGDVEADDLIRETAALALATIEEAIATRTSDPLHEFDATDLE